MPKTTTKRKPTTTKPRARRARAEDVIDVEAEPVDEVKRGSNPPPIVVHVAEPAAAPVVVSQQGTVTIATVQGVVRDVKHAVEVGRELGALLDKLFR